MKIKPDKGLFDAFSASQRKMSDSSVMLFEGHFIGVENGTSSSV